LLISATILMFVAWKDLLNVVVLKGIRAGRVCFVRVVAEKEVANGLLIEAMVWRVRALIASLVVDASLDNFSRGNAGIKPFYILRWRLIDKGWWGRKK
jgi:hypothetical protein